jgi:hypothetical protein
VKGFKENEFNPIVLWLEIYLLSLLAHSIYFLILGDEQVELKGQNGGRVNY